MTTPGTGEQPSGERLDRARQTLADIGRRARATNSARADEIESVLMAAVAGQSLAEGQRRSAQRAAHMIAGSAGTIGLHQVSELARELESSVAQGRINDPAGLLHAVALLREIQRRLNDDTVDGVTNAEPAVEGRREILLVTADEARADGIARAAEEQGWICRWAADTASGRAALRRGSPDVVVLDAAIEPVESTPFLLGPTADRPRLPTVVLGADDPVARADAVRAGADAYVETDRPPAAVVGAAVAAAGLPAAETARVVAVADPGTLDVVESALRGAAFDVTSLSDPESLGVTLDVTPPDVVVVAVDSPGGLALLRELRDDPRSASLSLLGLTSRVPDDVAAAYGAGADDVIGFPLVPEEVVARVAACCRGSRLGRHARDTDPTTGLPGRPATVAAVERLAAESRRNGSPLAVAMVDVDRLGMLNDDHGYAFGDLVLRRLAALLASSFREEDVVGRWAGQEYLVALNGLRKADGVARLAAVLESLRNLTFTDSAGASTFATFSAAVAEYPADGGDLRPLVGQLKRVLGAAKRAGGNRVLPVGWTPQAVRNTTDVFIVEDDEMLAGLLQQALETRGLRSEHEIDGRVALERLIGPNRLSARVILLDVDLPGMNGLDVLRSLETEGILQHSHVIMLTAYAGEQDVITAMRHGAFDHAAKPFSLPVLTQRLRRALDSLPPA